MTHGKEEVARQRRLCRAATHGKEKVDGNAGFSRSVYSFIRYILCRMKMLECRRGGLYDIGFIDPSPFMNLR
jgi:hypothetical protein